MQKVTREKQKQRFSQCNYNAILSMQYAQQLFNNFLLQHIQYQINKSCNKKQLRLKGQHKQASCEIRKQNIQRQLLHNQKFLNSYILTTQFLKEVFSKISPGRIHIFSLGKSHYCKQLRLNFTVIIQFLVELYGNQLNLSQKQLSSFNIDVQDTHFKKNRLLKILFLSLNQKRNNTQSKNNFQQKQKIIILDLFIQMIKETLRIRTISSQTIKNLRTLINSKIPRNNKNNKLNQIFQKYIFYQELLCEAVKALQIIHESPENAQSLLIRYLKQFQYSQNTPRKFKHQSENLNRISETSIKQSLKNGSTNYLQSSSNQKTASTVTSSQCKINLSRSTTSIEKFKQNTQNNRIRNNIRPYKLEIKEVMKQNEYQIQSQCCFNLQQQIFQISLYFIIKVLSESSAHVKQYQNIIVKFFDNERLNSLLLEKQRILRHLIPTQIKSIQKQFEKLIKDDKNQSNLYNCIKKLKQFEILTENKSIQQNSQPRKFYQKQFQDKYDLLSQCLNGLLQVISENIIKKIKTQSQKSQLSSPQQKQKRKHNQQKKIISSNKQNGIINASYSGQSEQLQKQRGKTSQNSNLKRIKKDINTPTNSPTILIVSQHKLKSQTKVIVSQVQDEVNQLHQPRKVQQQSISQSQKYLNFFNLYSVQQQQFIDLQSHGSNQFLQIENQVSESPVKQNAIVSISLNSQQMLIGFGFSHNFENKKSGFQKNQNIEATESKRFCSYLNICQSAKLQIQNIFQVITFQADHILSNSSIELRTYSQDQQEIDNTFPNSLL